MRDAGCGRGGLDGEGYLFAQILRPSIPHLGWAFLLAWVFCTFYLRTTERMLADASTGAGSLLGPGSSWEVVVQNGSSLSVSIAVLCLIAFCARRIAPIADRRRLVAACSASVALGTLLVCAPDAAGPWGTAQFWLGEILTGVGSGPMWVMWGELYARLERGTCETSAAASTLAAALVALACVSLDGWVSLAAMVVLPVLSGAAILSCARAPGGAGRIPDETKRRGAPGLVYAFGREGLGILVASMVICYAGRFVPDDAPLGTYQLALVCAVAVSAAIALIGILTPCRFNLQFLYRWMCPFVMVSLSCLIWFPGATGQTLSFIGSISARLAFCLITQVSFAQIAAARGLAPTLAFAWGWICLHLGDLAGIVLRLALNGPSADLAVQPGCVLGVLAVLVASVMLALNGRGAFGWGAGADAPRPSLAAADALGSKVDRLAAECDLTAREAQVLRLLAGGRSNPYIRDVLGVSLNTVGTHVKHVYAKLGVHSRQELIDLFDDE